FFQAEDGIRDRNVTGVQTCALPIYDIMTNVFMFTTPSCGGCKILKPIIKQANLPIEIVDATEDEARAEIHEVSSVPAFVVEDTDGNHVETLAVGAQEGIRYINENYL